MIQKPHLLVLFLVLLLGCGHHNESGTPQRNNPNGTPSNQPSFVSNGNTYVYSSPTEYEAIRQRDEERRKEDPGRWWKTPISFYGRIVDQYSNPVAAVNVTFTVTDLSVKGNSEYQTKSDANGLFMLSGIKGKHLMVYFSKDGYYQSRAEGSAFDYNDIASGSQYKPDSNHPELFHLYKGGEKVALIKNELEVRIRLGETVTVDISSAKTNAPNGQIRAELLENEPFRRGSNGTWSVRVSNSEGGIQFQTEEFPFVAPESGYRPSIDLRPNSEKPPTWKGSGYYGGAFYLKTRLGYVSGKIQAIPGNPYFRLSYYWNPSGSRNLEPDPNLLFRDLESYKAYVAERAQAGK